MIIELRMVPSRLSATRPHPIRPTMPAKPLKASASPACSGAIPNSSSA